MSVYDEDVFTPFYRVKGDLNTDIAEGPESNLNPYTLFVIRTNLRAYIRKEWNISCDIMFQTVEKDSLLYYTAIPLHGNDRIEMDRKMVIELTNEVNRIVEDIPNYVLLMSYRSFVARIPDHEKNTFGSFQVPLQWVKLMIPLLYTNHPEHDFKINKYGLLVNIEDSTDYTIEYNVMVNDVISHLSYLYINGYIPKPSPDIIANWQLEEFDGYAIENSVYHPSWDDVRITGAYGGIWNFIRTRERGVRTINYFIGDSLVKRHMASLMLSSVQREIVFDGEYAKIEVINLEDAQTIASMIDCELNNASGTVATINAYRRGKAVLYLQASKELGCEDCVVYTTTNRSGKYTFSRIIHDIHNDFTNTEIEAKVYEIYMREAHEIARRAGKSEDVVHLVDVYSHYE
jgi:hypothetical protein